MRFCNNFYSTNVFSMGHNGCAFYSYLETVRPIWTTFGVGHLYLPSHSICKFENNPTGNSNTSLNSPIVNIGIWPSYVCIGYLEKEDYCMAV